MLPSVVVYDRGKLVEQIMAMDEMGIDADRPFHEAIFSSEIADNAPIFLTKYQS